jgi:hypothetical protein
MISSCVVGYNETSTTYTCVVVVVGSLKKM